MLVLKNHVTLIGDIASFAEVTHFDNGNRVARFKMATHKLFRSTNGKLSLKKEWHQIFAWGSMARFIESYAEKGKRVAIHGRLVSRTFVNPKGLKRKTSEIELRQIVGL
jgi:single-strand DNA-binding protein